MRITGTAIKLGAFSLVLLLFTAIIVVVFGQMRFDRTTGYSAIFSNSSGLRAGQFVRASGVEVGKVKDVKLIEGGSKARVDFDVDRSLELFEESTASVRYLNLIGDRYLELKRGDSNRRMPSGGTIRGPWSGYAWSSACISTSDSVMSWPSSSITGSSPPGTLLRNHAGLSPYDRMLIFFTSNGISFSSSSSHTFWQYGHHAASSR